VASYSVRLKASAAKELERLPETTRRQIAKRLHALAGTPRPFGAEKLTGAELYRVRQGGYRIIYRIDDSILTVPVVRIGNRRDVYR
jgi:mRNA interferase RelE/StbE